MKIKAEQIYDCVVGENEKRITCHWDQLNAGQQPALIMQPC